MWLFLENTGCDCKSKGTNKKEREREEEDEEGGKEEDIAKERKLFLVKFTSALYE